MLFTPGSDAVVAQTIVQDQEVRHAPSILDKGAIVVIASVKRIQLALVISSRNAKQKVSEVRSRLCPVNWKLPLKPAIG